MHKGIREISLDLSELHPEDVRDRPDWFHTGLRPMLLYLFVGLPALSEGLGSWPDATSRWLAVPTETGAFGAIGLGLGLICISSGLSPNRRDEFEMALGAALTEQGYRRTRLRRGRTLNTWLQLVAAIAGLALILGGVYFARLRFEASVELALMGLWLGLLPAGIPFLYVKYRRIWALAEKIIDEVKSSATSRSHNAAL